MKPEDNETQSAHETSEPNRSHVLVKGHAPNEKDVKFTIGPYKILENIGKGGMGEVFLAYDTLCGRQIALKRIRPDLLDYRRINSRFLKEAHITSQLTHPSIIPIYAIHKEGDQAFYTMPYVQGETLKDIIRKTRRQERKGKKLDHIGGSIPALIRIFINICQAVAYAHSKNVLHRDLKPENIIVGQFGEVLILDWGLAKLIHDGDDDPEQPNEGGKTEERGPSYFSSITKIGKVVGTVTYMAPERALGQPSTRRTDIYSLGVILFQMLTLRFPFYRESLEEFRNNMAKEEYPDPTEVAPYRDVPRLLARITKKCLEPTPDDRYSSVEELIRDLENYIEGRAEWFLMASLDPDTKKDWEFQENVYLPEHVAITRSSDASDWMSLMISKVSFADNIKIEADVCVGNTGNGLGFLLSIPEAAERQHLNDGFCLWIGSDINKSTKLMRCTVEVIHAPEISLKRNEWHHISIDKIDNIIHFYLDGSLQFTYISHIPLVGTHVGLLSRDADFEIKDFHVFVAGQNVVVKCLAVPDAFLAHKDYTTALTEYRRIGYSFPGRAEGREAMFRAGITLLEQAKNCDDGIEAKKLFDLSLVEFEKLHQTPGAPLEYLGKALVYQALKEYDEEIKCFELGCRRYPYHPLLPVLQEQIVSRMHESSRYHRKATYEFILLTVRLLQEIALGRHVKKLFRSLQKHWEPLPFLESIDESEENKENAMHKFAIELAFWLAKPYTLEEIIDDILKQNSPSIALLGNALIALLKLGSLYLAEKKYTQIIEHLHEIGFDEKIPTLHDIWVIIQFTKGQNATLVENYLEEVNTLSFTTERTLLHLIEFSLDHSREDIVELIYQAAAPKQPSNDNKVLFDAYMIWSCLSTRRWDKASEILLSYPLETLNQESTILHLLYGCWLRVTEGKELSQIHFSGVLEVSYPRSWTLLSHYLSSKIHEQHRWFQRAFFWEKIQLYRQLCLYSFCCGNSEKEMKAQAALNELLLAHADAV